MKLNEIREENGIEIIEIQVTEQYKAEVCHVPDMDQYYVIQQGRDSYMKDVRTGDSVSYYVSATTVSEEEILNFAIDAYKTQISNAYTQCIEEDDLER